MNNELKYAKTKRALRRIKKRQEVLLRKRYLPMPTNVCYTVDETGDFIIVTGEFEQELRLNELEHFVRFKLSGQQDFPLFGYQAKIPIQNGYFRFEVLQDALLEWDYLEIQLFNSRKQYSDPAICKYEKIQLVKEVIEQEVSSTQPEYLSRVTKYRARKKQ